MNFDDYERYIIQKYRLVVAVAVLKTKPEETRLEQHITDLKNKFDDTMDVDITICSDDFNLDDNTDFDTIINQNNDVTEINDHLTEYNDMQLFENYFNDNPNSMILLKDYRDEASERNGDIMTNVKENDFSDVIHVFKDIGHDHEYNKPQRSITNTQSTYCESLQPNFDRTVTLESLTDNDKTICESIYRNDASTCNDLNKCNNGRPSQYQSDVNKKVIKVVEREDKSNNNIIRSNNELQNPESSLDNNLTYYDSQATEFYTLHGFTQNYTHVSQSQDYNIDISRKFITGIPKKQNNDIDFKIINDGKDNAARRNCNNMSHKLLTDNDSKNVDRCKDIKMTNFNNDDEKIQNYNIDVPAKNISIIRNVNKDNSEGIEYFAGNVMNPMDITEDNTTTIVNIQTDNNARSQTDNNTINSEKISTEKGYIQDFSENAQRDCYFDDYLKTPEDNPITNINRNSGTEDLDNNINYTKKCNEYEENTFAFDPPINLVVKDNNIHQDEEENIEEPEETDIPSEDTSEEELQIELVPYKVVEELNKVKTFLHRRESRMSYDASSDSGYKSDSQGRSHRNSLQLSSGWLHQSGHCIYEYIARCSLASGAQHINRDISQVLGELIDRLHEDEIYPVFLEELLEYHNLLIQDIFTAETTLPEKDEKIQIFLLLNKSTNILKYSIEKLTELLENIHKKLTNEENLYELTNIVELENTAYIFHMLEIIIKRYLKSKNIIESTQISQTSDNIVKKSLITDIWRKKWNPNYKDEVKIEGGVEKKCVITKCTEVLNKIVVECINGYSLISFAALQCFNLLHK